MIKLTTITTLTIIAMSSFVMADDAEVQALEKKCETARELKLKPLRDAEIARCKTDPRNVAGYCERFWSDYGAAKRSQNGMMQQRMFNDLPECIAADEARRKLRMAQ